MSTSRRTVLKASAAVCALTMAGRIRYAYAADWNKNAFEARTLSEAMKGAGVAAAAQSKDIVIKAPEIAENGAVVPIEVTSKIPGTRTIRIFAEKNPQPMVASFTLADGVEGFISTRIKLGETSNIKVVVNAAGKDYTASKEVKVTIGGCG